MKWKPNLNSLFVKILFVVVIGVTCVSVSVGYITINISRNIFNENYKDSQKKIFDQVNDEIYDFHSQIVKTINTVSSHRAFRSYFGEEDIDGDILFKDIYEVNKQVKELMSSNKYDISLLIVGVNGQTYLNTEELLTMNGDELLKFDITTNALKNNKSITYKYLDHGITASTKNGPVIIISKALNLRDEKPYGVINFIIKEKTFQKFYDYFTLKINDIVLLDENNIVISSNKKNNLGQEQLEFKDTINELIEIKQLNKSYENNRNTIFIQRLPYCNLTICGTVDNNKALEKMYDIKGIAFICALITVGVLVCVFLIVRQMTRPLYLLTEKMSKVKNGNFNEYIEVRGPEEIKELSSTYNYMIKDTNKYVNELMKVQKEKRKAEINALQMQINPHYIYNTLSSIKWLIWQGSKEKAISAIDAFINMLRNTISKTDEFVTVEEEIENLKNYVLINNIRFGDRIKVEYFVMTDCYECLIPKLILQPFIENSFFHAFPSEEEGDIQVFIKEIDQDKIKIEICDNGIGINDEKIDRIVKGNEDKNRYFSGIGINNVDSRIKLIYGTDYGISIKSKLNIGTTISIVIPKGK